MVQMCIKFLTGLLMTGILLFVPSGTIYYWNAWLFIGVLFVPMLFVGLILLKKAPELLEKRLNTKEKEVKQKHIVALSLLMFAGGFVVSGLDYQYQFSRLRSEVPIAAAVIFLIAYGLFAEIMRENRYLARTIEVQENQRVVDTGLYGVVRHPMYAASVLLFFSMPLVLGSVYAFIIFLFYPFLLVKRISNEEAVLRAELAEYDEYTKKVR